MNKKIFIYIILLATLLRFIGLISRPIWYDESFSILFAEKGPSAILSGTLIENQNTSSAEEHPPLYYFILWAWFNITNVSITTARIFSILFSLANLVIVYLITNHLFNSKTALIASVVFAILPFQIHYAQEIRMYTMLTFWLLLATFSFLKTKENKKWWILFSISCSLAQYTQNLAAIYLIPLSFTPILYKDWKTLRNLILAGLVSLTLYLPWLIHLPAQLSKVNTNYWVEKPGIEKIFTLILFYLPNLPLSNLLLVVGLLLAVFVVTLAFFQTYLATKNKIQNTNHGLWLAYLSFTPPLLLWTISQFVPVYIERALLPSHAIFCIWLAWSLTETKAPRFIQSLAMIMILASATIGFYQHITYKGFPYGQFNEINSSIENRLETGDLILHSSKLSYLPAFYFNSALPQAFIIDPPNSNVDTLAPATREILELNEFESIEQATKDKIRIWFVIYQNSIDEYTINKNATHPHLEYLNKNFILENIEKWGDIRVFLYRRNEQ